MKSRWMAGDIPDLKGKMAVVTGASGGIGYEIARELAAHGAHVVLASRDRSRTDEAKRRIVALLPRASVEAMTLDLADLSAVQAFARAYGERHGRLDILINNAGISGGPRRATKDGFELILQVNYLGHFALTGLLLEPLCASPAARVVTMSSDIASSGQINFDDLQSRSHYGLVSTYAQSKLATLLFAVELERRVKHAGASIRSFAANPGVAKTDLFKGKISEWGRPLTLPERLLRAVQHVLGHTADKGALPALYQATDPAAESARYVVGTNWPRRAYPVMSAFPARALDQSVAERLWETSVQLTGVPYSALSRSFSESTVARPKLA